MCDVPFLTSPHIFSIFYPLFRFISPFSLLSFHICHGLENFIMWKMEEWNFIRNSPHNLSTYSPNMSIEHENGWKNSQIFAIVLPWGVWMRMCKISNLQKYALSAFSFQKLFLSMFENPRNYRQYSSSRMSRFVVLNGFHLLDANFAFPIFLHLLIGKILRLQLVMSSTSRTKTIKWQKKIKNPISNVLSLGKILLYFHNTFEILNTNKLKWY